MKKIFFLFITLCTLIACNHLENGKWPKGKIPFALIGFNQEEKNEIYSAMVTWACVSNGKIEWIDLSVPNHQRSDNKLLVIQKENSKSKQGFTLNLGYNEDANYVGLTQANEYVATHELGHVLGLIDEVCRFDRNFYVNICWDKIVPELRDGFQYQEATVYDALKYPYDYQSIMHFKRGAWTNTVKEMGGDKPSAIDVIKINEIYADNNDIKETHP